jgi:hypothetical protein
MNAGFELDENKPHSPRQQKGIEMINGGWRDAPRYLRALYIICSPP